MPTTHVGRWWASIIGESVLLLGIVLAATSADVPTLFTGQFLTGCGVGFCSVAKPLYVCEKTPHWGRDFNMALWSLCYCTGIMLTYVAHWALPTDWRAQVWR